MCASCIFFRMRAVCFPYYSPFIRTSYIWRRMQIMKLVLALKFKVCKSVHHHTIQINQPTRCNNFSSLFLVVYLQRPHAHHQELNNCSSSLWFYLRSVVTGVLLVALGPTGPTTTDSTAINTLRR